MRSRNEVPTAQSGSRRDGRLLGNERGVALVTMMLLLTALTMLGIGAVMISSIDMQLAGNYYQNSRAFYAAEAGVEKALSDIQSLLDGQGTITDAELAGIVPHAVGNFTYEQFSVARSAASYVDTVDSGPYMGLVSLNQPITITSRVVGPGNSRYSIIVQVEGLQIPIFQFGVFYDDSLEIHNGAPMAFIGRVHTNSSLFLGTSSTTSFHRHITAAGDLYRFRIWNNETFGGTISIERPDATMLALTYDSQSYAGDDAGWVARTNADFQGRLRTRAHNVTPLGMPIPNSIAPVEIIKRRNAGDPTSLRSERLDWKADLRIYANSDLSSVTFQDNGGSAKLLTDPSALVTGYDSFYDDRQGQWVDLIELDVSKLTAGDIGGGVVYVSVEEEAGRHKGVKLINSASLPGPMTVASDNSIYIQGDYNTVNWQPSAAIADAVYMLSNSWTDAANHNTNPTANAASATSYNVAILSGDTPNRTQYNGGLENFPRFLENWNGAACNITGSFVNLFLSDHATGAWVYGHPVYTAPTRNWAFDLNFLDFNKLPPGTPSVGTVLRIAFRQEFVE